MKASDSSEPIPMPPKRKDRPAKVDGLIKQTYSVTVQMPGALRTKKWHVVAYYSVRFLPPGYLLFLIHIKGPRLFSPSCGRRLRLPTKYPNSGRRFHQQYPTSRRNLRVVSQTICDPEQWKLLPDAEICLTGHSPQRARVVFKLLAIPGGRVFRRTACYLSRSFTYHSALLGVAGALVAKKSCPPQTICERWAMLSQFYLFG
jgi:hypothetical protein